MKKFVFCVVLMLLAGVTNAEGLKAQLVDQQMLGGAPLGFAESIHAGLKGGLAKTGEDRSELFGILELDSLEKTRPDELFVANIVFPEPQSLFSLATVLEQSDSLLVKYSYVQRTDYGSGMRTVFIYMRPSEMGSGLFERLASSLDRTLNRMSPAIGSGDAAWAGSADPKMSDPRFASRYLDGIYAVQIRASAGGLATFVKATNGRIYLRDPIRIKPSEQYRIDQLEAAQFAYAHGIDFSSSEGALIEFNDFPCGDPLLVPRAADNNGDVAFMPCPDPDPWPVPPPSPPTTQSSEHTLTSTYAQYVQDPTKPANPPLNRVGSLQRVLMCGIDPATGQPFRFIPDYSTTDTYETENNCPADVTWAPDDRFNLGAENDISGDILITTTLSSTGQVLREEMAGVLRTRLKWGDYLSFIATDPGVASTDIEFNGDLPGGPGYFLNINTAAFRGIRPLCNAVITGGSAECRDSFGKQSSVIGVNRSPSYEDEVIFPNDACPRPGGIPLANRPCIEILDTVNELPCPYDDTALLDDTFRPTVGSGCADQIQSGMLYRNQFDIEIPNGADRSHLTKDTVHKGQIGTATSFGGSIIPQTFRTFAIDTRTLARKRAVAVP
ncbi:MAG: hypothetical protein AAF265_10390 [Pseudomonadota bacterium]